jgi:hypothetical protein
MAGQEIKGDLWDQSVGLDLLPNIVCAGFRTLSLASLQNFGSRDSRLTKLALDQASRSCKLTHVSKRMFYAIYDQTEFGMGYEGCLIRLFNELFVFILHYSRALCMQHKGTHWDNAEIF